MFSMFDNKHTIKLMSNIFKQVLIEYFCNTLEQPETSKNYIWILVFYFLSESYSLQCFNTYKSEPTIQ